MIQTIFQVSFNDGRIYRIACENTAQITRFNKARYKVRDNITHTSVKTNGIHTVKQWEQIVENEINN